LQAPKEVFLDPENLYNLGGNVAAVIFFRTTSKKVVDMRGGCGYNCNQMTHTTHTNRSENMDTNTNANTPADMIFTMGLPAAGKSYTSSRMFPNHTAIDPDAVKEAHPDYNPKNPAPLHAWSKEVTERQFNAALADGTGSYVIDGTGTNAEKMVRKMTAAAAAGFTVTLLYVKCTMATSLKRNAARERVVPEHIIRSKALDVATAFELVAPYAENVRIVNND